MHDEYLTETEWFVVVITIVKMEKSRRIAVTTSHIQWVYSPSVTCGNLCMKIAFCSSSLYSGSQY